MMIKVFVILVFFCAISFAQEKDTFADTIDGKIYKTVKIGEQIWMAENLEGWYRFRDARIACPAGWHLPSKKEWKTLAKFAGGEKIAGQKLKAKNGWKKWECEFAKKDFIGRSKKVNECNSDDFGFSLLCEDDEETCSWWTSTHDNKYIHIVLLKYNKINLYLFDEFFREGLVAKVRCLKD